MHGWLWFKKRSTKKKKKIKKYIKKGNMLSIPKKSIEVIFSKTQIKAPPAGASGEGVRALAIRPFLELENDDVKCGYQSALKFFAHYTFCLKTSKIRNSFVDFFLAVGGLSAPPPRSAKFLWAPMRLHIVSSIRSYRILTQKERHIYF